LKILSQIEVTETSLKSLRGLVNRKLSGEEENPTSEKQKELKRLSPFG
jgi:hypothetical protein